MNILVLGAGKVGSEIARVLVANSCGVTVVDIDAGRLLEIQSAHDLRTVQGNAADPEILQQAGIADVSIVVAVTAIDEVNLVACKMCSLLNNKIKTIARIRSPQYNNTPIVQEGFDITHSFCPEQIVAENVNSAIAYPGCLSVHHFADRRLALAAIRVSSKTDIAGSTIKELRQQVAEIDYRIVSVYRDNKSITPTGDTRLFVGDDVYLLVVADKLKELTPFLAGIQNENKSIIIAGGGNIGKRVAARFEKNSNVKIIEINRDRCRILSQELSNALILKGSATDEGLLKQENIRESDIFCALTSDDEENILSAMLAKRLGVTKTAVLINRPAYADILGRQLDIVFSPSQITIGSVLTHIRGFGEFNTMYSLQHGTAEAIEININDSAENSYFTGREIQEIEWPEDTLPGAIIRDAQILIAHDTTVIENKDHIICFISNKKAIVQLEKLISRKKE